LLHSAPFRCCSEELQLQFQAETESLAKVARKPLKKCSSNLSAWMVNLTLCWSLLATARRVLTLVFSNFPATNFRLLGAANHFLFLAAGWPNPET
jgi:hypothetical protein